MAGVKRENWRRAFKAALDWGWRDTGSNMMYLDEAGVATRLPPLPRSHEWRYELVPWQTSPADWAFAEWVLDEIRPAGPSSIQILAGNAVRRAVLELGGRPGLVRFGYAARRTAAGMRLTLGTQVIPAAGGDGRRGRRAA